MQSCGNPNWKLADQEAGGVRGEVSGPDAGTQQEPLQTHRAYDSDPDAPEEELPTVTAAEMPDALPQESSEHLSGHTSPSSVRVPVVHTPPQYLSSSKSSPKALAQRTMTTSPQVEKREPSMAGGVHFRAGSTPTAQPHVADAVVGAMPTQPGKTTSSTSAPTTAQIASDPCGPFALSFGEEVTFHRVTGQWQAQVKETLGACSREQTLPVRFAGDPFVQLKNLQELGARYTKNRIHILQTDQAPWAPRCIYVGAMGLKGGGNSSSRSSKCKCAYPSYIRACCNSDDESDGEVRSDGYRFYRDSDGDWSAYGYPVRAEYRLSLSANDIRRSSWTFHDCRVGRSDCITLCSSYSTIASRRADRRMERRRTEERRQEAARAAEAARKQAAKEQAARKEKEAAQQRITDRQALSQKVATQAIEDMNSEAGSSQFWNESPLLQKQHDQLLKAITATQQHQSTGQV